MDIKIEFTQVSLFLWLSYLRRTEDTNMVEIKVTRTKAVNLVYGNNMQSGENQEYH